MAHIQNGIVSSAEVTMDRGSFLSVWLHLDYGGSGQGFGGYVLGGTPDSKAGQMHATGPNFAAEFLVACMRVCDVEAFDKCAGKAIRVRRDREYGQIEAIGHITKDVWFSPTETFEKWGK